PTSREEIDAIDEFERSPDKKRTREWRKEEDRRQLRSAFRLIWFNSEIFSSRDLSLPEDLALGIAIEARPAVSVSARLCGQVRPEAPDCLFFREYYAYFCCCVVPENAMGKQPAASPALPGGSHEARQQDRRHAQARRQGRRHLLGRRHA